MIELNADNECGSDNVAKSKSLHVAYTTLMVEIWPASSDISLYEIAESSLKIDPNNVNPFCALVHRLCDEGTAGANPFGDAMAARIPEIDPTSPYAQYYFPLLLIFM